MRLIGLTGGIGCGKTTVANYLGDRYKIPIWDADLYAREAVLPTSEIFKSIVQRYGVNLLQADGTLNRPKLGDIIFNNPEERRWLEEQIHPWVRQRFLTNINSLQNTAELQEKVAVLVIPLLFEANMTDLVTEIWVVYLPEALQIERLMQRDRLTDQQALERINSQMPLAKKCDRADVILDNSGNLADLLKQIDIAICSKGNS
ncbi:MAG: dephospho-CoA kinase [Microcoleaceae cyanobacterium]